MRIQTSYVFVYVRIHNMISGKVAKIVFNGRSRGSRETRHLINNNILLEYKIFLYLTIYDIQILSKKRKETQHII